MTLESCRFRFFTASEGSDKNDCLVTISIPVEKQKLTITHCSAKHLLDKIITTASNAFDLIKILLNFDYSSEKHLYERRGVLTDESKLFLNS